MTRQRTSEICGLCGAFGEVTREHFVPKGLWPGERPSRTETIPACYPCNAGTNLDDEYFRNTLAMMLDLTHPDKRALFAGPVLRSFKRHPARIEDILKNLTIQPMWSPSGLWLGDFPAVPVDVQRFERSLVKIVKSLFYLIRKSPFPHSGRTMVVGELNPRTRPLIAFIEENLFPPTFDFGDDVFEWRFSQTKDGLTLWKLAFYRTVVFYACGFENADNLAHTEDVALHGGNESNPLHLARR